MLSLVKKKGSIKQFVVYCFGCKEKWGYRGGGGLNKFQASERGGGAYLREGPK